MDAIVLNCIMDLFALIIGLGLLLLVMIWGSRGILRDMKSSMPETSVESSLKKGIMSPIYGCPNCLSEYKPEIEICPDCKTKLVTIPNWTKPE